MPKWTISGFTLVLSYADKAHKKHVQSNKNRSEHIMDLLNLLVEMMTTVGEIPSVYLPCLSVENFGRKFRGRSSNPMLPTLSNKASGVGPRVSLEECGDLQLHPRNALPMTRNRFAKAGKRGKWQAWGIFRHAHTRPSNIMESDQDCSCPPASNAYHPAPPRCPPTPQRSKNSRHAWTRNPPFFDFEGKKDIHLFSFSLEKTQAYLHGNWIG